ncbi:CRISPR associated protein of unknown function [Hyphomicrobium sulfonivorans]|uniref:Uncharacterized protein n=1 Tax=Hyphomicrobium sulfonivorans TaxID=121290 RepID=A0A125NUI9_HYPSL|nr:CRISPR associated protein of unknown function [Hyphomicrobium sulfonivorans]
MRGGARALVEATASGAGAYSFGPASAGNTLLALRLPGGRPVQPRACGQHRNTSFQSSAESGSAPRVRGTLAGMNVSGQHVRFSPAGAGNTPSAHRARSSLPVQPRACGEHTGTGGAVFFSGGSAPRVRGTPASLQQCSPQQRFSPARAGNTYLSPSWLMERPVQPRACGEHVRAA